MTGQTELPDVLDTWHFRGTGLRLDLTGPGPWQLTGFTAGGVPIDTTHEGPIDYVARKLVQRAYPDVKIWQAKPALIDEAYQDSRLAAYRICQLLGVELATARAVLTIAADDILGSKFVHGKWEITGDDDDQSFRIRTIDTTHTGGQP